MIRGAGTIFWEEGRGRKKIVQQKVIKIVVQQTVKNKKFVHKTARETGLYEGEKLAHSFAREKKKSLFLVRSEKESVHRGKENHSFLSRIIWSGPILP